MNRLTAPAPLFRVGDWALEEVFDIETDLLNDDRLARALVTIAPHLDKLAGSVGAGAISAFGLDTARIHWDMTSMSVHGAYPAQDQDGGYPVVKASMPDTSPSCAASSCRWGGSPQVGGGPPLDAGVTASWVTGDEAYGQDP